jgi:hypothetical protein
VEYALFYNYEGKSAPAGAEHQLGTRRKYFGTQYSSTKCIGGLKVLVIKFKGKKGTGPITNRHEQVSAAKYNGIKSKGKGKEITMLLV